MGQRLAVRSRRQLVLLPKARRRLRHRLLLARHVRRMQQRVLLMVGLGVIAGALLFGGRCERILTSRGQPLELVLAHHANVFRPRPDRVARLGIVVVRLAVGRLRLDPQLDDRLWLALAGWSRSSCTTAAAAGGGPAGRWQGKVGPRKWRRLQAWWRKTRRQRGGRRKTSGRWRQCTGSERWSAEKRRHGHPRSRWWQPSKASRRHPSEERRWSTHESWLLKRRMLLLLLRRRGLFRCRRRRARAAEA